MAKTLKANVWVDGEFYAAGATPPKAVADKITNPHAWEDDADTAEPTPNYGKLSAAKLKAEIEKRNEDRPEGEPQLSTEGSKDDLIAVLQSDDAAHAGA